MCDGYDHLAIAYFFKTFLTALFVLIPILLTALATRDVLKSILKNKKCGLKPIKKLTLSFVILLLPAIFTKFGFFSNSQLASCWNNANIETLAQLQDPISEDLAYVPVVVEPIYIENPYKIDIDALKTKVETIIGNRDISLSFYNPISNQSFNIDGDKLYIAASVSKIHAVLNVYDYAHENNIDLKNVYMTYKSVDFQGGSGVLQSSSTLKTKEYSLYELCELTIRESDNIAWNMIRRYMNDKRSNTEYYKNLVNSDNVIINGNYAMTANWGVSIMKKIYYNQDNNPYYEKLIFDMKNTFDSKIVQYLDTDIVAHKTGELYLNGYLYANDVAIVYSDSEYILTVFSKTKMSPDDISSLIGEISLAIYEEIARN